MIARQAQRILMTGLALCLPAAASGQACTPRADPVFEFEVDVPASTIPDSTHPHPAADRFAAKITDPDAIIVQFVVDTAGVPLPSSFKVLKAPSQPVADSARIAFPGWRFTPARKDNCLVAQLVQTTVVR